MNKVKSEKIKPILALLMVIFMLMSSFVGIYQGFSMYRQTQLQDEIEQTTTEDDLNETNEINLDLESSDN